MLPAPPNSPERARELPPLRTRWIYDKRTYGETDKCIKRAPHPLRESRALCFFLPQRLASVRPQSPAPGHTQASVLPSWSQGSAAALRCSPVKGGLGFPRGHGPYLSCSMSFSYPLKSSSFLSSRFLSWVILSNTRSRSLCRSWLTLSLSLGERCFMDT